jgi:AraC-like DNA-binding protein
MFDPRQEMGKLDFELQYKRDSYLKDVELHHHDFFELYFLLSGDVTYIIESKIYHVMPGDILLISPKELHQLVIRPEMSNYERYVLWVDPQALERLGGEADLSQCFDPANEGNLLRLQSEERSRILALMEALHRETQQGGFGSPALQESLLVQLLVQVNRLALRQDTQPRDMPHINTAVSKVIDYVNLHYGEQLSLDMLAERFFVSKYHLSHTFTREVGVSLHRYITLRRLLMARQLLSAGVPAGQVCSTCGFSDYTSFYRAFKAEYGLSPGAVATE